MKVLQVPSDKAFIYELGPEGTNRWFLKVYATGQEAASQEEVEWIADKIVQALDGKEFGAFGCYCDLMPGEEPETCVIDDDRRQDCNLAINWPGRKRVERKEECQYWRRIV